MTYNEQEWRRCIKSPGGVAVCMSPFWLLNGCPICGCKEWTVTNDYWSYCENCGKGISTEYAFTHSYTAYMDKSGLHCGFCRGFGECEHCRREKSQPNSAFKAEYNEAFSLLRLIVLYPGWHRDYKLRRAIFRIPVRIRRNAARSLVMAARK